MKTIRWFSTLTCVGIAMVLACIPRDVWSLILAALFLVCFTVLCWSFGAFRRDAWVSEAPLDAHLSRWDDLKHDWDREDAS